MAAPADPAHGSAEASPAPSGNARCQAAVSPVERYPQFARLRDLPVVAAVTLAERRIPLAELLQLGPGTLLTFEKPCEDLLDLYVENRLVCRGEAVKVGDKFGLRITSMSTRKERNSPVVAPAGG